MKATLEAALDNLPYSEGISTWHILKVRIAARKATRRRNTLHEFWMDKTVVVHVVFHALGQTC
jgi:hypothetical protein